MLRNRAGAIPSGLSITRIVHGFLAMRRRDWTLITRPVFQVMSSSRYVNKSGNLHRITRFGDSILATQISPCPKLTLPWLLGAVPSFIFPTASSSRVEQNKWQLGPAGVFGYLGGMWLAGVFPQKWFSLGGPGS
jgi:hypothetical protein